ASVAERMAARAARRRRLVVDLIAVARDARGAFVARPDLVPGVARLAVGVSLARVQAGTLVRAMTRRARGRRRGAAWTVRAVTARARDVRAVSARGLGRVARRAGRRRLARAAVRLVAARARLVSRGRGLLLLAVTRRARRWRILRAMRTTA